MTDLSEVAKDEEEEEKKPEKKEAKPDKSDKKTKRSGVGYTTGTGQTWNVNQYIQQREQ